MSDKPTPNQDQAQNSSIESSKSLTAKILFDDTKSGQYLGRFDNPSQPCENTQSSDKVPTLLANRESNGCTFKGVSDLPKSEQQLDFPSIYKKAAENTVRLDADTSMRSFPFLSTKGSVGSGSIIGADKATGECYIATNHHISQGTEDLKVSNLKAVTADGKTYPTKLRLSIPESDISVFSIKTGKNTDSACKPFTPIQDSSEVLEKPIVALGFPSDSKIMYASPGIAASFKAFKEFLPAKTIQEYGMDPDRQQMTLSIHAKPGNSGGPLVNEKGKLAGLMQAGDGKSFGSAVFLDKERVDNLLAESRRRKKWW